MIGEILGAVGSAALSSATQYALNRQEQMWSKKMSGTSHQREMVDLQRAGLNPVLAAHGSGAPMPSAGSTAGVGVGSVNTALSYRLQKAEIDKIKAEQKTIDETRPWQVKLLAEQMVSAHSAANLAMQETLRQVHETELARLSISKQQRFAEMYRGPAGEWLPYLLEAGQIMPSINMGLLPNLGIGSSRGRFNLPNTYNAPRRGR